MNQPRPVVILGSTGSVGTQALDVIRRNPDLFRVVGLAAGGAQLDRLAAQAVEFGAEVVGINADALADLTAALDAAGARGPGRPTPKLLTGPDAAGEVAGWPLDVADPRDGVVLNAVTGSIGLAPTLAALRAGRTLALANKESLIVGGPLVKSAAAPGQIVPVDSEHSALAQCLRGGRASEVRKLVVTASGGPFRGRRRAELRDVTPAQALAHPTWRMGPVITVNSATLVNKGLEVIEAHLLFDVPFERIDVVVHPQSIVHSMVEFVDGSTIAQASPPDMRLPISLGLDWPHRVAGVGVPLDFTSAQQWTFEPVDEDAFPALPLAKRVGAAGATYPAVFNAANEQAVAAFHDGRLGFLGIVDTIERVVDEHTPAAVLDRAALAEAERWARERADVIIATR